MAVSMEKSQGNCKIAASYGPLVIVPIDWAHAANPHRVCDLGLVARCPIGIDHRKAYEQGQECSMESCR